eukprot:5681953-Alexandrium_andersonii.AAC.1
MEAATWGAAPWKLGVLSGLLLAFDVFVKQDAPGEDGSDAPVPIAASYVARARQLLHVLTE